MTMPARSPAPEPKKGRKYDQVIRGARSVFMQDGFEGASVDDIARTAGVSKATLYSYFPDKERLFMEVVTCECRKQADGALDEIDQTADPRQVLRLVGERLQQFVLSDFGRNVFRICVAESDRFPSLGHEFYECGPKLVREQLGNYLRCATERGEFEIKDFDLAADQFAELCKADIFARILMGVATSFTPEEARRVIDGAVDMFCARYAASAARH